MTDSYKLTLITMLTWFGLQASYVVAADQALEALPTQKSASLASETLKGRRVNAHALSLGDIQNIQSIGRSVLAAKHSQPADDSAQLLKQNIETLHQRLVELERSDALPVTTFESTDSLVAGPIQAPDDKTPAINQQSINAEARVTQLQNKAQKLLTSQGSEQQVKQQADQVRQQIVSIRGGRQGALSTQSLEMSATSANGEPPSDVHHLDKDVLTNKAEQLLTEVDQALASSGEERTQKIAALRQRLTTKNLSELQGKTESVPTISTITHHRP